jgi:hypothetical protein
MNAGSGGTFPEETEAIIGQRGLVSQRRGSIPGRLDTPPPGEGHRHLGSKTRKAENDAYRTRTSSILPAHYQHVSTVEAQVWWSQGSRERNIVRIG